MRSIVLFLDEWSHKVPVEKAVKAVKLELDNNGQVISRVDYFRDKSYFNRSNSEKSLVSLIEKSRSCHIEWSVRRLQ